MYIPEMLYVFLVGAEFGVYFSVCVEIRLFIFWIFGSSNKTWFAVSFELE